MSEIGKEIQALPKNDPKTAEGKIRQIDAKISALPPDNKLKRQLETDLREAAGLGLSEELRELMRGNGLSLEGLALVLNNETDKPGLALFLHKNKQEGKKLPEGFEIISRKIGPLIEVLGGLKSHSIDVSKEWAKKLQERAPSLLELSRLTSQEIDSCCEGSSPGDRRVVDELMKLGESAGRAASAFPVDNNVVEQNARMKQVEVESLQEARKLMTEAQALASTQLKENETAVKEKLSAIYKKLEIPSDWYKQDKVTTDELLKQVDNGIKQFGKSMIEAREPYNSLEEIVAKASGGLALHGVIYSKCQPTKTAGMPILLPSRVDPSNTTAPYEIKFLKFTEDGAAARFVEKVKSSGYNIGFGMVGFYGLAVGEASAASGSEEQKRFHSSSKTSNNSVSVTNFIRCGMGAFQIRRSDIRLCMEAQEMALSTVDDLTARLFFDRYGSHVPCGVHNLGGIFFRITEAKAEKEMKTSTLAQAAASQSNSKVSAGFLGAGFGGGASLVDKKHTETGEIQGDHNEKMKVFYSFSSQSIGPSADNPHIFKKLLSSNNSTWAILDRGDTNAYIPVWELLVEQGEKFKKSADVMKKTWDKDYRKMDCKAELKSMMDKEYHKKGSQFAGGYWLKDAYEFHKEDWMKEKPAYEKAINLISDDPERTMCKITFFWGLLGGSYTLTCWKIGEDKTKEATLSFGHHSLGEHVLFYSKKYFIWKNQVPSK